LEASVLRIAFIKDWHDDPEHIGGNKDGILAAIDKLAKKHYVSFISRHTDTSLSHFDLASNFDVILCWGSLDRPWHGELPKNVPALLCFAGGPLDHPFLKNFKHIFVESKVYEDKFREMGVSVSRAFGTNTDVFRPDIRITKKFKAIYPASFCFHKNQELFARAMGTNGLCVGTWNEESIVSKCLEFHTPVMRRVSSNVLSDLFNMSNVTVIPCGPNGGSQRTVLESMACGIPVVLAEDNDKCVEFVIESGFGKVVPPIPEAIREAVEEVNGMSHFIGRDYVLSKWTHHHYAESLEKGIIQCLKEM
jgi:glycosyltransferase involved in cell wall biosynthesis